jgi:hypothetical protein
MKKLLLTTAAVLASTSAFACAPAPSCWLKTGPSYVRSICQGYAKDHRTVAEITTYLDEPEKIQDFVTACKKLGVAFPEADETAPQNENSDLCAGGIRDMRRIGVTIGPDGDKGSDGLTCDLNHISKSDFDWIVKVCGQPMTIGEEQTGKLAKYCRLKVKLSDQKTEEGASVVTKVLHVTNKPKFSWESNENSICINRRGAGAWRVGPCGAFGSVGGKSTHVRTSGKHRSTKLDARSPACKRCARSAGMRHRP